MQGAPMSSREMDRAADRPTTAAIAAAASRSPRTAALLEAPIVPTLLRLSWPNILVTLAQPSTGLGLDED